MLPASATSSTSSCVGALPLGSGAPAGPLGADSLAARSGFFCSGFEGEASRLFWAGRGALPQSSWRRCGIAGMWFFLRGFLRPATISRSSRKMSWLPATVSGTFG